MYESDMPQEIVKNCITDLLRQKINQKANV